MQVLVKKIVYDLGILNPMVVSVRNCMITVVEKDPEHELRTMKEKPSAPGRLH